MRVVKGITIGAVILLNGCTQTSTQKFEYADVSVNGHTLSLAVANSAAERQQGLSNLEVPPRDGMLFVFDQTDSWGIWMKEMRFAIDIVWLRDGRVVQVANEAMPQAGMPDSQLTVYRPDGTADIVIELASGRADQLGIIEGVQVEFETVLTE